MVEHGAHALASLRGMRVLVTRPRHQSAGLAALIERHGGTALRFPVIDILPSRNPEAGAETLRGLDASSLVIFISPNAVHHGLAMVAAPRIRESGVRLAAVGESTAAALEQAGFDSVLRPADGASSESLLAMPELGAETVSGRRIVIVRGEGGRGLLGETLSKRGARVTYAQVYRRARPAGSGTELARQGREGGIDAVVVTSAQGMDNLFALMGEDAGEWLTGVGYVLVSERLAAHARGLGVRGEPVIAAGADDQSLLEALERWRRAHPRPGD